MPRKLIRITSFVCLWVLICTESSSSDDIGELVQINVAFRHGARTPFWPPYPTSYLPQGTAPMQLLPVGMRQLYNLGKKIKDRYISGNPFSILPSKYDFTKITVNSSIAARTLESAYSFLAGLYPPEGSQIWNQNLLWQPIPVYTRDAWDDPTCNILDETTCPTLKTLRAVEIEKHYNKSNRENKEFFEYLDEKTGNKPGTTDLLYAYFILDSLTMARDDGHLPEWANEVRQNNLTVIEQLIESVDRVMYEAQFIHGDLKKIIGGKLLENITNNMKLVTNSATKAFVYSIHQDNMGPMLSCLGLFYDDAGDMHVVLHPSAVVVFELYNNLGQYSVKLAYKDGPEDTFKYLTIPGCGTKDYCTLKEFEHVGRHCFLDDWRVACGITKLPASPNSGGATSSTMMAGIVGSVLLVCIVLSAFIIFVVVFRKNNRPSAQDYQTMN